MKTPIYILHHSPANERKVELLNTINLLKLDYPVNWVENFLPEEVSTLGKDFNISIPEMSLSLKHEFVLLDQVKKNLDKVIILEDDADLLSVQNLQEFLENCLLEFSENNGDILWIGGTHDMNVPNEIKKSDKVAYFSKNFKSRCAHAYIMSLKAARAAIEHYHYNLPADHLFNEIIDTCELNSGWTSTYITQKSLEKKIKSLLR
jgi:hypothetical protein